MSDSAGARSNIVCDSVRAITGARWIQPRSMSLRSSAAVA